MSRQYDSETKVTPCLTRASEHSIPFSDLRADPDTRLLRVWFDSEADLAWRPLDIARGGLSIVRKFDTVEHNNTVRNSDLLKQMSRSAFALYQPDRLTDDDGNLLAIALPRNSSLQLGNIPGVPFDALRGGAIATSHLGLYIDNNDVLAVEAYELDNIPQIEVIAADSQSAVRSGLTSRSYLVPRRVSPDSVGPLTSTITVIEPQFLSNSSTPQETPAQQSAQSVR